MNQELLGTPSFLPGLLSHINRIASPATIPLDQVIFQSILLCLIAQDKHLIFRTHEEDICLAVQLIAWTLSSVFNLQTNTVKVRNGKRQSVRHGPEEPGRPADKFLLSLFLHSNLTSFSSTSLNLNFHDGPPIQAVSQNNDGKKPTLKHSRQMSSLNNPSASVERISASTFTGNQMAPQAIYGFPNPNHRPVSRSPSPLLSHANTEPLPVASFRRRKRLSHSQCVNRKDASVPKKLPQALLVFGLENADQAVQRSLAAVLGERKVVLDDGQHKEEVNCPESFICVYVCTWNSLDRPSVHKTLLDKFSMSTNVFIPQSVRNDFRQLFSTSLVAASPKPLRYNFSYSNPGSPTAPLPPLPPSHTPPVPTKALPVGHHDHHLQSCQHQPQKPASQHGTSGSTQPPSYPLSSATQQSRSLTPLPLLPSGLLDALREMYRRTSVAHAFDLYASDLMSAARQDSRLDGTLLTAKAMKDLRDLIRASRVIGADLTGMELVRPIPQVGDREGKEDNEEDEFHSMHSCPEALECAKRLRSALNLEVSEVDVARIFPRVVSHRLRMRAGPEDEVLASTLFGATFDPPLSALQEGEMAFNSVKSLLVKILSEV